MRNIGLRGCDDTVLECLRLLPKLLPPPLLAALCLALATSPLAQAQDATSMTLSVGPSKTATPTPAPEKPILEIWAGAPDHQKPAPIPGQTPRTGEPVTPAPKAKRTRVKRHPTLTPLSSAKTVVVSRLSPCTPTKRSTTISPARETVAAFILCHRPILPVVGRIYSECHGFSPTC